MSNQADRRGNTLISFKNISQPEFTELLNQSILLGVGSFSTVFRIPWNGETAALKVYRNDQATEDVCREISLLAKCDHPNIVKLIGAGPSFPERISFLAMEFAECFSVNDVLYKLPDVRYELAHCLHWIARAADGADYLHYNCQPRVIHGDLKPANLLLFNSGLNLKLTDFGSARSLDSSESRRPGTLVYTAPEISCVREGMVLEYTDKSDVYSLTVSLWEILARQRPYANSAGKCQLTMFWNVYRRRPTPFQQCPPLFSKLLERGWNEDPCKRPTMRQISTLLDGLIDLILSPTHAMNPLQIPSDLPQKEAFLIRDTWDLEPHEPQFVHQSPPSDFSTVPGSLTVPHHVDSVTDEQLKAMQIDSLDEDTPDAKRQKRPSKTEEPLSIVCNWERD